MNVFLVSVVFFCSTFQRITGDVCWIYADPYLRPFGQSQELELGADVMPIGTYILATNNAQACAGATTQPAFEVDVQVGAPYYLGRTGYGWNPNSAITWFPQDDIEFHLTKYKTAYIQRSGASLVEVTTFPSTTTLSGGQTVTISTSSDGYVSLSASFGLSVAVRGWDWNSEKWGRIKLELPSADLGSVCGICKSAPPFAAGENGIQRASQPFVRLWSITADRFRNNEQSPVANWVLGWYANPRFGGVKTPTPLTPSRLLPAQRFYASWHAGDRTAVNATAPPETISRIAATLNLSSRKLVAPTALKLSSDKCAVVRNTNGPFKDCYGPNKLDADNQASVCTELMATMGTEDACTVYARVAENCQDMNPNLSLNWKRAGGIQCT